MRDKDKFLNNDFYDDDSDVDKSLMSGWMKKKLSDNRKFFIILAMLFLIAVVGLVAYILVGDKQKEKKRADIIKQINGLNTELSTIDADILKLQEDYGSSINGKSCVVLAFTDMVNGESKNVIKYMNDNGYVGLLVFNHTNIPGSAKGMSLDTYRQLLDKGWEASIGTDGSVDLVGVFQDSTVSKWENYVKGVQSGFEQQGLAIPKIYCFNEEENYGELALKLSNLGFDTYISISNTADKGWYSAESKNEGEMSGIQADYEYIDVRRDIEKYSKMSFSTTLLFNTVRIAYPQDSSNKNTSYSRFKLIIDCLNEHKDDILITNVTGYKNFQNSANADYSGARGEYQQKKDELLTKKNEILKKIEKLQKEAAK